MPLGHWPWHNVLNVWFCLIVLRVTCKRPLRMRSFSSQFNKFIKTLCQGHWPRGTRRNGQNKVAFLLEKGVESMRCYSKTSREVAWWIFGRKDHEISDMGGQWTWWRQEHFHFLRVRHVKNPSVLRFPRTCHGINGYLPRLQGAKYFTTVDHILS